MTTIEIRSMAELKRRFFPSRAGGKSAPAITVEGIREALDAHEMRLGLVSYEADD